MPLKGLTATIANLQREVSGLQQDAARALFRRGEAIMTDSKDNYVPTDLGALKGSGHVELPEIGPNEITVTLGYGGSASDYALAVHEHLSEHSPPSWRVAEREGRPVQFTTGGPKYLEKPVLEAARTFQEDLAADMRKG